MPQNAAKCRKFPLFNLTRNFEFFSTTLISREKMDLIGQNKEIFSNLNSNLATDSTTLRVYVDKVERIKNLRQNTR